MTTSPAPQQPDDVYGDLAFMLQVLEDAITHLRAVMAVVRSQPPITLKPVADRRQPH